MNPEHYLFIDERLLGKCVFCGGPTGTRDHIPSKILLDDPLPSNLAVVESCADCNQSFSLDEEYLACFLEVVLKGASSSESIRPKVAGALRHNPRLATQIQSSATTTVDGSLLWVPDYERVQHVLLKLARGHAAFELSLSQIEEPAEIWFRPLVTLTQDERVQFEEAGAGGLSIWPEIGTRAFLRAAGARPYENSPGPWITVQPERYRYSVEQFGGVRVQMVLSEYLACEVIWE